VDTVFNGCWRKSTLLEVGLFDEALVRNSDDELNFRIAQHGGSVWKSRRVRAVYYCRESLRALIRQQFEYGYWKAAVLRKHGRPARLRHLIPGAFVASYAVLGLAYLWTGNRLAAALALAQTAVYLAASGAAAVWSGWREPALMARLPLVFAAYQFSYGCGFLRGLGRLPR
jgi:GT2 family glycosyltransferase